MSAQHSTAVSDTAVAASAFLAAVLVLHVSKLAGTGFIFAGFAAVAGVVRFSSSRPSYQWVQIHQQLSSVASGIFVPSIAAAHLASFNSLVWVAYGVMIVAAAFVCVQNIFDPKVAEQVSVLIGAVPMLVSIYLAVLDRNYLLIFGYLITAFSGLVVGTSGSWNGILRVDIFHYILSAANVLLVFGVKKAYV